MVNETVGSTFGRFFTVGVNEPKPNGPDTINMVEKNGLKNWVLVRALTAGHDHKGMGCSNCLKEG